MASVSPILLGQEALSWVAKTHLYINRLMLQGGDLLQLECVDMKIGKSNVGRKYSLAWSEESSWARIYDGMLRCDKGNQIKLQSSPKGSSQQWKQTSRIPALDEHIQRWPSSAVPHLLDFLSPWMHTDNLDLSNHYMGAQMTQSTLPASSPHSSDSSKAAYHIGSASMHMSQLPTPEPTYISHPGYATYHLYGVPPHWMHSPTPPYTPVVPLTDGGAGVAHHMFQAGQNGYYPPAVDDVPCATQIGQYLPANAAAPPPARTPHHQPFPSIPGGMNPHAYPPPIPHQAIFNQHHGPELSMGSASLSLPQAPSCQKPVLDEYVNPQENFYTRGDSYKRHLDNGTCEWATAVVALPSASQDLGSCASPAPVAAPTMVFAYACLYPRFAPPMSQNVQSGTPSFMTSVTVSQLLEEEEEEEEEEDNFDFWEANEI
ncbi:hypothetical protein EV424DRAFT_1346888 [Suillus variegatus]|nr:hypothetical protein EV424DRAFT_1346888 [Suillus variegatus]